MPLIVSETSVRECFVPRPGNCYIDTDIEALELCTLAQVEIWTTHNHTKAKQLNAGIDPHCITGAEIAHTSYEKFRHAAKVVGDKVAKNQRNLAKVPNFGKPGGMADTTLVSFARTSYGIRLGATPTNPKPTRAQAEAEAVRIGAAWRAANPHDQEYLNFIRTCRRGDRYEVIIGHPSIGTCIRRGKATYCAAANSLFQGLGAIAAGEITYELQRACYATPASPLYGWRLVMHAYDEWLLEGPIGRQTEAAVELDRIVTTAAARKIPDVRIKSEAVAMSVWAKQATRIESATGELLLWQPPNQ